jgi:hypothetical protein
MATLEDDPPQPASMFWLPMEHSCGCVLDWGCDSREQGQLTQRFLPVAAGYPCPLHGSASGSAAPSLRPGEVRFIEASGVYYREAAEDQRENGQRNRRIALSRPGTFS